MAEKLSKIEVLRQKLEKDLGKGTLMYANEKPNQDYVAYSTGSITADLATGCNGFPKGKIIEIYGDYSTGKTLIALNAIIDCQKKGDVAAFIDMENAIDLKWAQTVGVNIDELLLSQPNSGEEAIKIVEDLLDTGEVGLIIIDSVAALIPQAEIEGEIGEARMGLHARLMGQAMRKLSPKINKNNTCTIWLNQTRMNIGNPYEPIVQPGGRALRFFADMRISLTMGTKEKDGDSIYANQINGKIIKNKCSTPFKTFNYTVLYGVGIDTTKEIIELAVEKEIIQKSGSWFSYGDAKIGQGLEKVRIFLEDNSELFDKIKEQIK